MEITEVVTAYGHSFVQATHRTTLEVTKDSRLTKKGDCIVAVKADKSLVDLSEDFKEAARTLNAMITVTIEAGEAKETVKANGDVGLLFNHPTDMVVRKSSYMCSRTLAVKADKASNDLSRKLVEKLRNPYQKVKITLTVNIPEYNKDLLMDSCVNDNLPLERSNLSNNSC